MKILVTGATGFIGQNLVNLLMNKNFEIFCLIRKNSDTSKFGLNIITVEYDSKLENLVKLFQENKFDGVIHLASLFLSEHKIVDVDNIIFSNIKFGTHLLEASKQSNVKWFINTGTFWQNYENNNYNPVNLYAATKEAFENIAKYYTQTSNLIFTTIKLNDTFGPNDTRNKVFNIWSKIGKSQETLEMSPGEQIIDISFIDDVISAYDILISHMSSDKKGNFKNKVFVVTNNERVSLKELSKIYEDVTNTKLNIVWGSRPYRDREVFLPYNRGKIVPGWKQKYTFKEAIKKLLE